jgi:HEAT repeat protein
MRKIFAFVFTLSSVVPVYGQDARDIRETVRSIISKPTVHLSVEAWRAMGPDTASVIISLFPETQPALQKIRLLEAAANFDDDSTTAFLKDTIDRNKNGVFRRIAIRSLGIAQGLKEREYLSRCLKDPDANIRFAAAQSFQNMHEVEADKVLKVYLAKEKAPWIAKKLSGATIAVAPQ